MSEERYGICNECGCSITQGHYRHCSLYEPQEIKMEAPRATRDYCEIQQLERTIERLQGENRRYVEALEDIRHRKTWVRDTVYYLWLEEVAQKALSNANVELYSTKGAGLDEVKQAEAKVIEVAIKAYKATDYDSRYEAEVERDEAIESLLEHNNAGGES